VSAATAERELLAAAKEGDERAFERFVAPHRSALHAHCYRMLGSVHDADDALQDAMLRAWRGLPGFEGRSSPKSWLYRIATNASLDTIGRRPKARVLPLDHSPATGAADGPGPPLAETVWIEPYADAQLALADGLLAPDARYEQRESVELAFVAALQHLAPRQRAVLILREVLGFSAREVAELLDTTVASVNSALQRARETVDGKLPDRSQQATLRALGDDRLEEVVRGYLDAWERGEVDEIAQLLAEDVVLAMPPMATWYRGEEVFVFLREWAFNGRVYDALGHRRVRVLRTWANGQPALGVYSWDDDAGEYRPTVLQVLTLGDDGKVREVMGFVTPAFHPRHGLPEALPG